MRISASIFLFVLLFVFNEIKGQGTTCHHTTEGTEFWFGFMQGRDYNNQGHSAQITVTARKSTTFMIYIGKSTTPYNGTTYTLTANSSLQITLPLAQVEATGSESVQDRAIHLVANDSVNVYALNWAVNSSDVAVMYPVKSLGTMYYTMCYTPHVNTDVTHGRNSEFLIVASEDNTTVKITPSVVTTGLKPAKTTFSITLNKGEVYQVQSLNASGLAGQGDLTGSYITSDKPVAVYAGSLSTTIPVTSTGGWDHLYEQMPPINAWGMEYYAVPLALRAKHYFRVMSSQDTTAVYIGSTMVTLYHKGDFHEFILSGSAKILADKPVLVSQYSPSKNNDGVFDGFMVILSPVSQAKNDVTFVAYTSTLVTNYYVNIVTPTSETGNIQLDGATLGGFNPFPDDQRYSYVQRSITMGTHRLRNLNPNEGFIAYVYGFGSNEAYGYGVGFNLNLILDLSEDLENLPNLSDKGDTLAICQGESVKLDAGPYFDYYKWSTGDSVRAISVSKQARYKVTAWTVDGCIQSDSIYILVRNPQTDIGKDLAGCPPFSAELDGGDGFKGYLWSTGETSRIIVVDSTGQYSVKAIDRYGCPAKDTILFTVYPVPDVSIDGSSLLCGTQSGTVKVNFSGTDDKVWTGGSFKWETDQPAKLNLTGLSMTSADFNVKDWGKYDIRYTLTTVNNCLSKDILEMGIFQTPTSEFTFVENPTDKCAGYSREILYAGNATSDAAFYWDYGGSKLVETIDRKRSRVSLGAFNSNPFISLYVEENGCHSDTFKLAIGANPDFTMNTVKSRGCDTATIYFSGSLKVPDALKFEWDFGDKSPVSTRQNTSHFYYTQGNYDVSLLITTVLTGCKTGFTVDDMVKIFNTPVAKISIDPAICYDDTIPVYYTLNIDSSLCEWKFSGASQIGKGNDSIRILIEKPVATISLQVDEYGCKSKWAEATVKRKPNFDFIADTLQGCQPMNVKAEATKEDSFLEYTWMTDTLKVTGREQSLFLAKPGKITVSLAALSTETGCRDTVTKTGWIWVHSKPVAAFDVDYPVAILGQSNLQFTNQTTLADNFNWDFSDGFTSMEKDPRHNFTKLGKYSVLLNVESGFGCKDTAEMSIEILPFDMTTPNAFRPDSYIDKNRVFMPFSIGVDPEKFHIQIFNRWGQVVFESKSLEYPWDGTLKNGMKAAVGNYVWIAEYYDIQGFRHQRKGQVLLIR